MKIGLFIRKRRLELGLSQGDLARLLNLNSVQLISNIERQKCGFPRKRLKRLSRALLMDRTELFKVCVQVEMGLLCKDLGIRV